MSSLIKLTRTIHFFRTIHNNIMHVCTMCVYKYSVDMYLLRLGLGGVLVVCGEYFNLG